MHNVGVYFFLLDRKGAADKGQVGIGASDDSRHPCSKHKWGMCQFSFTGCVNGRM